ncbi:hypothetical protein DP43_6644 [Burkholderia pseudomallei]|nr:hypothetical protein BBK_4142 [Burkholderia pseudomallei NCTC 13179]KGD58520.1 hypothetical protein DP43_6644 [Burkholderia pseudomallei]
MSERCLSSSRLLALMTLISTPSNSVSFAAPLARLPVSDAPNGGASRSCGARSAGLSSSRASCAAGCASHCSEASCDIRSRKLRCAADTTSTYACGDSVPSALAASRSGWVW